MLGDGASMAISSIWASMANWSAPTVLFCVINLMIAIIFIASNFKSPNHHNHNHNHNHIPNQLARSPSLLDRVNSLSLSSFYTTPESHNQYYVHSEKTESSSVNQLSRSSSLLQRVKSIDFSFSSFHNLLPTESEPGNSTSELTRAPSLLDRIKSFKFTSSFNSDHLSGETSSGQDEHSDMDPHHDSVKNHNFSSSESHENKLSYLSEASAETPVKGSPRSNILKSRSEKRVVASDGGEEGVVLRRPATMKASAAVHDESVDAKADDFIKRFKHQLKLQRIDSLKRFREMLNRGTSSA